MNTISSIDDYIWPNRYLLNFLGFWPLEPDASAANRLFAYFRIAITIVIMGFTLFVPGILMIIVNWGDISILAEIITKFILHAGMNEGVGCIVITTGQLMFKLLYTLARHQRFHDVYRSARDFWLVTDDKAERESFEALARLAKQISIAFFLSAISNIVAFTTASVIVWINNYYRANGSFYERNLPFESWYGVDEQQTPNFEILFCLQNVAMVVGATGVVAVDATMMTLILHICGQFRLIQTRFRGIAYQMRELNYSKFRYPLDYQLEFGRCIEHHQNTISFANEMNAVVSPMIFVQLMTSGVEICLSGYVLLVATSGSLSDTIRFVCYPVTMFVQLVIWCWPGELLIVESSAVGDVVFHEVPLFMLRAARQRDLSFVIVRSQRECQVKALGFQVMSLRKLTEVFNTAASYFALLRSMSENQIS